MDRWVRGAARVTVKELVKTVNEKTTRFISDRRDPRMENQKFRGGG